MKSIFMRVLFCKIHCPSFICFCKPSTASHLYNSGPLKLENSPHPPQQTDRSDQNQDQHQDQDQNPIVEEIVEEKEISEESEIEINVRRSCMKNKGDSQSGSLFDRKKVQWMDDSGKQLVDIKEFESSETGDTDNEDDNSACFCSIL